MFSKKAYPTDLSGQVEVLERRVIQLEASLNKVLQSFRMPLIEEPPPRPPAAVAVPSVQKPLNHSQSRNQQTLTRSKFAYRPLNASRWEIRVLVLQSSLRDDDPIRCEMVHIGLDEDLRVTAMRARPRFRPALMNFNALSYTWGESTKGKAVILENHSFPVTDNLYTALRHLRNSNRPAAASNTITESCWWIDAMCINQQDDSEKGLQVSLMTRIYKRSFAVHIWVGDEGENSSLAMDLLSELSNWRRRGPGNPDGGDQIFKSDMKTHWKALAALFQRPYWSRVWVRQEVAVPNFAMVHCGSRTCQLDEISAALDLILGLNGQFGSQPDQQGLNQFGTANKAAGSLSMSCFLRASLLCRMRTETGRGTITNYLDLKDLLFHTKACRATDPRDKVFSMLGLADPTIYTIRPDYTQQAGDVFRNAARCVISTTHSLDILSGAQNPNRLHGLPSWVPNLFDDWKALPFDTAANMRDWDDMRGEVDFSFGGPNKTILRTRGRKVGAVTALINDSPSQSDSPKQLEALLAKWKELTGRIASHSGNDKYNQQFLNSLTGRENERYWLSMLSLGTDSGRDLRYSKNGTLLPDETPVQHQNPKMIQKLLAPDADIPLSKVGNTRMHAHLRKVGIGRKLGFLGDGSQGLLPADTKIGDEVCYFRRTTFPYVVRKVRGDRFVVVGEAYVPRYTSSHGFSPDHVPLEKMSIV